MSCYNYISLLEERFKYLSVGLSSHLQLAFSLEISFSLSWNRLSFIWRRRYVFDFINRVLEIFSEISNIACNWSWIIVPLSGRVETMKRYDETTKRQTTTNRCGQGWVKFVKRRVEEASQRIEPTRRRDELANRWVDFLRRLVELAIRQVAHGKTTSRLEVSVCGNDESNIFPRSTFMLKHLLPLACHNWRKWKGGEFILKKLTSLLGSILWKIN